MSGRTLLFLVVAVGVAGLFAAGHPAIPAEANPADAPGLRLEPKAAPVTSFEFTGRIKISNKDVSFEVPADYQESFSFWTQKMKGIIKEEKVEYITVTRDLAEDGSVPFRRLMPRYDLEVLKPGMYPAVLPKHIRQAVITKVWEGTLDQYGNVIAMEETAGDEDDAIKELSFPFLDHLFPRVDGPIDLKIGEQFTSRVKGDLPTRLPISGLEDTGLIMTRTYKLKEVGPERATFGMTIEFAVDPDRPPSRERTSCVISGKGAGDAVFDVKRGVFTRSKVSGTLIFDIEAPLRKLPTQAEDFDPGVGSTRVVIGLEMAGEQKVTRLFGKAEEPAPAAN